jgi:hypothetical protein
VSEKPKGFSSEAQRKKFAEMVRDGKMKQSVYDEWLHATGGKKLPERVKPKVKK